MACCAVAFTCSLMADEFDNMHKQLDIMSNIIKSSASVQNGRKNSAITGVESTYLKGQGVVFTINSSSHSNRWGNYNFNFVMPDIPPIPPLSDLGDVLDDEHEFTVEINEDVTHAMENATNSFEKAMDELNDDREIYRSLRDQQRDLSYEVRDLEREKRDIQYQLKRADKDTKSKLMEEIKQLESKRIAIEKSRVDLSAKSAELRKQQDVKKQEQEKERVHYYQKLTTSLVESFCLYGNGLKAVPKNENVSLIIKSAGNKDGRRYKDKIYVFSKEDILHCAIDKITPKQLLAKGNGYQF